MFKKYLTIFLFVIILILGVLVRFYKLDKIPPSLNWDEVAAGYNAYTIANWGRDEYGKIMPIVFTSFKDDKHPVHIYITSIIVKIFGLSDYSVRSSSALIGVLTIIASYVFVWNVLKDETISLFSSLFIAFSSYAIHYSRGLWEANFALFFLMAGLAVFYYSVNEKVKLLPLSILFFGLSFFSYHSAKIVVPPLVMLVFLFNYKKIISSKKSMVISLFLATIFLSLVVVEPRILGFARASQNKFSKETINENGGLAKTIFKNYTNYFDYKYLFVKGDQNPRASVKSIGQFYKIDLILFIIGLGYLVKSRNKQFLTLLTLWLLLSPIPGALSSVSVNATRTIFILGPILLISACGAGFLVNIIKNKYLKVGLILGLLLLYSLEVKNYLVYYFTEYSKKEAIEWQYGMKDMVMYVKNKPEYYRVYVDKVRQQPYIFFLFYLKTPLPELLSTVKYDESESKSYNAVYSFDRYQFGGWDIIGSYPNNNVLYAITPSYYGGLRYLDKFDIRKLIKYPDKSDAFYLVSGYE